MAVTLHAHRRGLSIEEFATIALDPHHGMSKWYRNRGRKLLDKEWAKAVKKAAEPQPEVSDKLKAISSVALVTPFPGRGGVSEYAVLHGILTRARGQQERPRHQRAHRRDLRQRLAEHRGQSHQASGRSRMASTAPRGGCTLAAGSEVPAHSSHARRCYPWLTGILRGTGPATVGLLDQGGRKRAQLFHRLLHTPVTQAELVEATGRSRNNVHKHLQLLRADGLLVQVERRTVARRLKGTPEHLSVRATDGKRPRRSASIDTRPSAPDGTSASVQTYHMDAAADC